MRRIVAVVALLACAVFAMLAAQDKKPEPEVLTFRGVVNLNVQELSALVQNQTGETISIDEQLGGEITHLSPREGTVLDEDELFMVLQLALEEFRNVLVPAEEGWKSVPADEAHQHAPKLTRAEAEASSDWKWANVRIELENADVKSLTNALLTICSGRGGRITTDGEHAIELCDRADRLREMFKLIDNVVEHDAPLEKTYVAPAGLTDQDVILALNHLFTRIPGTIVSVNVIGDGVSVTVKGAPRVQALAVQVIDALKE
ncbi:MAG: hypothetical protein H6841_04225 [Planctomycetes bacterium]|nr:hypothetical protein [Planctomycetota bacterium]MCB9934583.1 hypothetical protein [Planctomycetota bacterium]